MKNRRKRPYGFTLIELLTVILVISILAALVIQTAGYVQQKAARGQAEAEIHAIEAALERYKADFGIYPDTEDSSNANELLYQALTGDGNTQLGGKVACDGKLGTEGMVYMELRPKQGANTYRVLDPWGVEYKFNSHHEDNKNPASYDLWSTGGGKTKEAQWITNW